MGSYCVSQHKLDTSLCESLFPSLMKGIKSLSFIDRSKFHLPGN